MVVRVSSVVVVQFQSIATIFSKPNLQWLIQDFPDRASFFPEIAGKRKKIGPRGERASLEMHKVGNVGIKDLCRG